MTYFLGQKIADAPNEVRNTLLKHSTLRITIYKFSVDHNTSLPRSLATIPPFPLRSVLTTRYPFLRRRFVSENPTPKAAPVMVAPFMAIWDLILAQ
jgi:hypothetical protein